MSTVMNRRHRPKDTHLVADRLNALLASPSLVPPGDERNACDVDPDGRWVGMVSTIKGEFLPRTESGRWHSW